MLVAMASLAAGDTVRGYTIDSIEHSGWTFRICRAHRLDPPLPIALRAVLVGLESDVASWFDRSLEHALAIDHPAVEPVDSAWLERTWYMSGDYGPRVEAYEAVVAARRWEAPSLSDVLSAHGPLAPPRAAQLVEQLASGLDAVHAQGFVHRLVTPDQIRVEDDAACLPEVLAATLLPFKVAETDQSPPVSYGPEHIKGGDGDPRTDVYALGSVLYEMLTGSAPYADAGGLAPRMWAHLNDPPPVPSRVNPS